MFPNMVPMERYSVSRASGTFIYIHWETPVKEPSHVSGEKHKDTVCIPTPTEGLHTMGCGLVPQWDHL